MVGVGGFGVVYRAMWKSQRMIVAIKKIQNIGTESQRLGEKEVGANSLPVNHRTGNFCEHEIFMQDNSYYTLRACMHTSHGASVHENFTNTLHGASRNIFDHGNFSSYSI